jgi:2-amino-4-hydroxy-6-hydroxymethyldihydropteridine diphosphokinase
MKQKVFLGLGSNVGNRITFLAEAFRRIAKIETTDVTQISSVYETEPVGGIQQNEFLNAVLECETELNVTEFHRAIKNIEREIGRKETVRWGPREIDIDILLFGQEVIHTETLSIPHREIENRNFVLVPFSEIGNSIIHPEKKITIDELLKKSNDVHSVKKSESFTHKLELSLKDLLANETR